MVVEEDERELLCGGEVGEVSLIQIRWSVCSSKSKYIATLANTLLS